MTIFNTIKIVKKIEIYTYLLMKCYEIMLKMGSFSLYENSYYLNNNGSNTIKLFIVQI